MTIENKEQEQSLFVFWLCPSMVSNSSVYLVNGMLTCVCRFWVDCDDAILDKEELTCVRFLPCVRL